MVSPAENTKAHHTTRYRYIDALRGYAVLLVITCHAAGTFPQLPYPVKRLTNFGWHGVQLFFLMSCVTLLLSWRADEARGQVDPVAFWIRRIFRIMPMYLVDSVFYFFVDPPKNGFSLTQFLATLGFVNAWTPNLLPTVPDRWVVVPGGWSVGVEFTFYAMFPLIAMKIRSLAASLAFCGAAFAFGCIANPLMRRALAGEYDQVPIDNFMYFWFPSQFPVFAMGTLLFLGIQALRTQTPNRAMRLLRDHNDLSILLCLAMCVAIAHVPFPQTLPFSFPYIVPTLYVASAAFMVAVLALAANPSSIFVNRPIRLFGKVSFSAFLLHFAVLQKLPLLLPGAFDVTATGWRAIMGFAIFCAAGVAVTFALSLVTFRLIENPMIGLGRRLLARRARQRSEIDAIS